MAHFLAPPLAQLRAEINALWPHRDKTSDGWIGDTSHQARPSDHNPDYSAGGIVRAIDIDEDLTIGLAEVGAAMPLVNAILRDPRVRYVIYEGRIWYVDTQRWEPYSGPNAHRHHVHVSVRKVGNYDRDASPWNLAARISNTIGIIPTVSIPHIPGAPAPITPEDDMPSMHEFLNTPAFDGGPTISEVLRDLHRGRVNALTVRRDGKTVPLVQDIADGTTAALKAVEQTGPIIRSTGPVSLRQEAADSKTNTAEILKRLGDGVDYSRIDRNTRAAVADGVAEVVGVIEGNNTTTAKKG